MHRPDVSRYMTISAYAISCDQPIAAARDLMDGHGIRHLPVTQGGTVVGVVSQRDIAFLDRMPGSRVQTMTVESVMTPDPYIIAADALLEDVVHHMTEHKIGSAVVVDGERLIGMFTTIDALRALGDFLALAADPGTAGS